MIRAGIDAGASRTKVVIVRGGEVLAETAVLAGLSDVGRTARQALSQACEQAGIALGEVDVSAATGFGRRHLEFVSRQFTEGVCLARGVSWLWPEVGTVLDVGFQKSLAVTCDRGRPLKMKSNDRCASGSGRFLEMVADIFGVGFNELGPLSLKAARPVEVENTCAVFAESEIITLVHRGKPPQEIIRGVHQALARRVYTLLLQVDWSEDLCLVGGMAKNPGFVRELEALVGVSVVIPPEHEITAPLGAALSLAPEVEAGIC
ncbi:MAG: acyl-CoA dehydratase activase [Pseudomonadota bacterium]